MTRINTNVSSLTAQQNLAKSNDQLQTAMTRLSTGLRINSGKDDPSGLIAAAQLGSQIASTNQAISNTTSATNMIDTADTALTQVTTLLNTIQTLITQTANDATMSDSEKAANQTVIDSSLAAINRIAQTTTYQGRNLLDGSLGYISKATTSGSMDDVASLQINSAVYDATSGTDVAINVGTAATVATVTATLTSDKLSTDLTLKLTGNDGSHVFTFAQDASGADVQDAINALTDSTGITALDTSGSLALTSTGYGSKASVQATVISGTLTLDKTYAKGADVIATVNGITAQGNGNTLSVNTGTLSMSATMVADATGASSFTITGGGATFQLGSTINTNNQARMGIQSVDTGSLGGVDGLLYQLASDGNTSLTSGDLTTASKIVTEALDQVTSLSGRLGAFESATLKTNSSTLTDTVTALTSAQSNIQDADFATETANLTRAQILVQSGTAVLKIANKNPENVLTLLQ
jgi:flagellin